MFFLGASVRLVAAISVAKCYNDESELRSFKRNGRLLANDIGYSKKKDASSPSRVRASTDLHETLVRSVMLQG